MDTPAIEIQRLFAMTEELCKNAGDNGSTSGELRDFFKRSKDLRVELIRDNEQLRVKNILLERQKLEAEQRLDGSRLGKENEQLKAEVDLLGSRLDELERKSKKFRSKYDEIEQYNMALSNVYVA